MATHDGRDVHVSAQPAVLTPTTQTPESFKRRSACAARSNVLVSAAAQHGEGEALRHRRRACAALRHAMSVCRALSVAHAPLSS